MTDIFVSAAETAKQKEIAAGLKRGFAESGLCPKVYIETYGCQQNEADSERLLGLALECGYTRTDELTEASLVIVNTCAIREHAELKAFSNTGKMKKLREDDPSLIVALCGCMAQEPHVVEKLKKSYPYVNLVFGTDKCHLLPEMLSGLMRSRRRVINVGDLPHADFGVIAENQPVTRLSAYKAWVSVMYGCNNYCTYCIVPYVRGRERSRREEDIFAEVSGLVDSGYADITLLGQNVNSYRGSAGFPELLGSLAEISGDFRLRFMTSHPKDASHGLIDVMSRYPEKIARHFHLPVQSGSDRVLKEMNRRYTRAEYLEKAAEIREKNPGIALTTDIICGFPGETDEDFEDTVSLVKQVGFDMIYTFIYSPRRGTAAEKMPCQIPHGIKVERFDRLSAIQNDISLKINEALVGETVRILSDGEGTGRTTQNKIVNFSGELPAGRFAEAVITAAHPYTLDGKIKG